MEFIAYNTNLDVKSLIKEKRNNKEIADNKKATEFKENKKRLLPYVLQYLHYMVELHNSIVIKNTFACGDYRSNVRITSIRDNSDKIDLQETLDKYTNDCFFKDNGATYECNMFGSIIGKNPKIWLNSRKGCHVANPNLEYSMTGSRIELEASKVYAESIEDYIKELTELWINSERA